MTFHAGDRVRLSQHYIAKNFGARPDRRGAVYWVITVDCLAVLWDDKSNYGENGNLLEPSGRDLDFRAPEDLALDLNLGRMAL